jgi:hypothetical protein
MVVSITKRFPSVGACGLDCGLCPRYHTVGSSRCPGCAGQGFSPRSCRLLTCCVQKHHLECCANCPESAGCRTLARVKEASKVTDSFISYVPIKATHELVKQIGIEEFAHLLEERITFLKQLIEEYDDGRSKAYYCLAVQLLPLNDLKDILAEIIKGYPGIDVKAGAAELHKAFNTLALQKGLTLKLRHSNKEAG